MTLKKDAKGFDKDFLLTYYHTLIDRIRGINDRVWTQAKYFTTLFISMFTIPIIIFFQYSSLIIDNSFLVVILIILPSSGIVVIFIAYQSNLKQFKNLYEYVATMSKIEETFGLNNERSGEILIKDRYLLPEEYLTIKSKPNYQRTNEFVEKNLLGEECEDKIGYFIRNLYKYMLFLGILEISIFISVFLNSWLMLIEITQMQKGVVFVLIFILSILILSWIIFRRFLSSLEQKMRQKLKKPEPLPLPRRAGGRRSQGPAEGRKGGLI